MDLTIKHLGRYNSTAAEGRGHRRVLVLDTLDIALLCVLTATMILVFVLVMRIKKFRRRRSRSYNMASEVVNFINKEVSTQACQLEILTETKCVYVQMYDGPSQSSVSDVVNFINKEVSTQACQLEILTETKCVYVQMYDGPSQSSTMRSFDAWTQTNTPSGCTNNPDDVINRKPMESSVPETSIRHSKKYTGIIETLNNFYSRHNAENQALHPFSVSQLVPSGYKGRLSWKQESFDRLDESDDDDPRDSLENRSSGGGQRHLYFRRRQNEDGAIEGFESPIFHGVTSLDEYGQPISRL